MQKSNNKKIEKPFDNKLNILVAYPYFTDQMISAIHRELEPDEYRLIVDSGAFSAYNAGIEVKLDDYCNFIRKLEANKINMEAYIQLDVVFNEEETLKNLKIMKERGFNPAPVFTRGANDEYFKEMVKNDEYVFVGGVQKGTNHENFAKWILENSMGKKVHLLAFIRPDFINHYKPYSVDSSSWSCTSRFGNIAYYANGRMNTLDKNTFSKKPPQAFLDSCKKLGICQNTIDKLRFNDSWKSFGATQCGGDPNVPSKGLAQLITLIHYAYYTVLAQNRIGTKIYMAVGQPLHFSIMCAGYKHLKRHKLI